MTSRSYNFNPVLQQEQIGPNCGKKLFKKYISWVPSLSVHGTTSISGVVFTDILNEGRKYEGIKLLPNKRDLSEIKRHDVQSEY